MTDVFLVSFNSLTPGKCGYNMKYAIFKCNLVIDMLIIYWEIDIK